MLGARRLSRAVALGSTLVSLGLLACAGEPSRPHVVLIVVDTVRADRLSCYGYERPTTPRICALAERGIRFANASSTSVWTLPAHASLFTGLHPIRHGATQERARLGGGAPTLAEILGAHGYATIGLSANPLVSPHTGLSRGFDVFAATWRTGGHVGAERHPNLEGARRFLARVEPGRPFFLFVNFAEAHEPYTPPEPHRSRFVSPEVDEATLAAVGSLPTARFYLEPGGLDQRELALTSDLYDAEIAHVDALLGALVDFLEESGRLRDTLLVVTSDHGENLGDHGHFRHVFNLYGSAVRVPLVVVPPGGLDAGVVREEPVDLIDVFATILASARIEPPAGRDGGRDLLDGRPDERPLFAEYYFPLQAVQALGMTPDAVGSRAAERLTPHLRRLRSVKRDGWRLIVASDGRRELYDLTADPGERRDLAGDARFAARERELAERLTGFVERGGGERPLPRWPEALAERAFGDVDPETGAALRALGYVP